MVDLPAKPPDPTTGSISFAVAVARPQLQLQPRFDEIPLPARQYGAKEGKPLIPFSSPELDAGANPFQFSLIAKFSMGRPPISVIRETFQANWPIKRRATISDIWDGCHLLIIFDCEEDVSTVLVSPLRRVQHVMFRLFRYTRGFNPKREVTTTTKWFRLPNLPPHFFHRSYIGAIINSFASFLDIDARTKACATLRYARACAEIDVIQPIPDSVWIALPDGQGFWQPIEIEGNIKYCSHCRIHGHEFAECRKKVQAAIVNKNNEVDVEDANETSNEATISGPGTGVQAITIISSSLTSIDDGWTKVQGKKKRDWKQKENCTGTEAIKAQTVAVTSPSLTEMQHNLDEIQTEASPVVNRPIASSEKGHLDNSITTNSETRKNQQVKLLLGQKPLLRIWLLSPLLLPVTFARQLSCMILMLVGRKIFGSSLRILMGCN